jgi:hypothetical protein
LLATSSLLFRITFKGKISWELGFFLCIIIHHRSLYTGTRANNARAI